MAYERSQLTTHTRARLALRWPMASASQLDRFAVLAQEWRELKAELDDAHRGFSTSMLLATEPHLTAGQRSSLDPRLFDGEPAGSDGISPRMGAQP